MTIGWGLRPPMSEAAGAGAARGDDTRGADDATGMPRASFRRSAGAGGMGHDPLIYCRIMVLTTGQREALKLLANAADGYTVPFMLSHGCSVTALRRLARCRLAITDRVRVPGERATLTIARLRISDAGRKALAR
jgi:hypothetical protein